MYPYFFKDCKKLDMSYLNHLKILSTSRQFYWKLGRNHKVHKVYFFQLSSQAQNLKLIFSAFCKNSVFLDFKDNELVKIWLRNCFSLFSFKIRRYLKNWLFSVLPELPGIRSTQLFGKKYIKIVGDKLIFRINFDKKVCLI